MKTETKNKLKNFTVEVLDLFLGIPESIVNAFDRKEFYRIVNGMPTEKVLTCSNISKLVQSFKRSGYIEIKRSGGQESICFTNKARLAVIDRIAARGEEDEKYRFVSFDIPEKWRARRNQFRSTIKRLGFRQIQKSLWVCNKNIGNLVDIAADEYKVGEYVVYIVAEATNINEAIGEIFTKKA
jgi:hypothetical protein